MKQHISISPGSNNIEDLTSVLVFYWILIIKTANSCLFATPEFGKITSSF